MHLLTLLGIAMVALAAYSAGAVLAARGRPTVPGLPDLALALMCAAAACAVAVRVGRLPGLGAALVVGAIVAAAADPVRARGDLGRRPAPEPAGGMGAWKRFSRRMGNFQGRMILGLLYFVLVAPFALAARFRPDPLAAPGADGGTLWLARSADSAEKGMDGARRQS
ncbi:MAG: hypothetical protein JWM27_2196 [Gemmatimonadetes bacterium]|nr:hypothetical protein [Gemmatimonadota bacterium]